MILAITVIEDKAQQAEKHITKHLYWESHGVYWERYPLPVGDYILANEKVLDVISRKKKRGVEVKKMDFLGTYNITVDTKKDMQEIVGNICGKQHERFRDECILAQNNDIKLIVLCENEEGVKTIADVFEWENPRSGIQKWITTPSGERRKILKYPTATRGATLARAMKTMQDKYGVEFRFCTPEEAGQRIVELLEGDYGRQENVQQKNDKQ